MCDRPHRPVMATPSDARTWTSSERKTSNMATRSRPADWYPEPRGQQAGPTARGSTGASVGSTCLRKVASVGAGIICAAWAFTPLSKAGRRRSRPRDWEPSS